MRTTTFNMISNPVLASKLQTSNILLTQQRLSIARLLFSKLQHLSANQVFEQLSHNDNSPSQATVYNTLRLFLEKGLLSQVIMGPNKTFYDTNLSKHHHLYNTDTDTLKDVPINQIEISNLPELPPDTLFDSVDIIVRVRESSQ